MNRIATLVLAVSFLIAGGCATQTRTSTSVALTITSDTASNNFVNQIRDTTIEAIADQVPNARPMTVNVKLDVTAGRQSTPAMASSQPINAQRPVATLSPQPWLEPAPPTVPVHPSVFGTDMSQEITGYRLAYTISDAAGNVVESNQLTLDQGQLVDAASHTALKGRKGLVNDTADFLASRVKTLSR